MRAAIEDEIERLIAMLDDDDAPMTDMEPDACLEPNGEDEPSEVEVRVWNR